jgi:tRNA(Ile)-lysidine synthetase-like protein
MQPDAIVQHVIETTAETIDRHRLLTGGAGVVVAVSGGPDSVALLDSLRQVARQPRRDYRLTVAHLHHGLTDHGDRAQALVTDLCDRWQLPRIIEQCDVRADALASGRGLEETARDARYHFLAEAAEQSGAQAVATAHQGDDNAETILHHLLRGTHLRGLGGMPMARRLGRSRLIRPLLDLRRRDTVAYCQARQLPFVHDPMNEDPSFTRVAVRRRLLPDIRQTINPQADEALLRLARSTREVCELLDELAGKLLARSLAELHRGDRLVLQVSALSSAHPALRQWALRTALRRLGAPLQKLSAEHIRQVARMAEADGPTALDLPGRLRARREPGGLTIAFTHKPTPGHNDHGPIEAADHVELATPGTTRLPDGRSITCRLENLDPGAFADHRRNCPPGVEVIDAETTRGRLIARGRRPGDAFTPLGAPGRKTLSDLLTDDKVPSDQRGRVVVVRDQVGIIAALPVRIADRAKITDRTRRVLWFELSRP